MQTSTMQTSAKRNKTKSDLKNDMKKNAKQLIALALEKNAALFSPAAVHAAQACVHAGEDGHITMMYLQRRTLAQNACMWALLTDISKQVNWGGAHLTKEEWKHLLAASLKRRRMMLLKSQGQVTSEPVNMATSTSCMNMDEMSEFIDYIVLFGLTQSVAFSSEKNSSYEQQCSACSHANMPSCVA